MAEALERSESRSRMAQDQESQPRTFSRPGRPARHAGRAILGEEAGAARRSASANSCSACFPSRRKKQRKLARQGSGGFRPQGLAQSAAQARPESSFFPLESVVFQRIALARLARTPSICTSRRARGAARVAWHRARIGIKHFRYMVENFLPQRYAVWDADLKRFPGSARRGPRSGRVARLHSQAEPEARSRPRRPVAREDRTRAQAASKEFLQKSSAANSPWSIWRAGFQQGHVLVAASFPQRRTA